MKKEQQERIKELKDRKDLLQEYEDWMKQIPDDKVDQLWEKQEDGDLDHLNYTRSFFVERELPDKNDNEQYELERRTNSEQVQRYEPV